MENAMSYEDDYEEAPLSGPDSMTVSETTIKWKASDMFDAIAREAASRIVKSCERDLVSAVGAAVKDQISAQVGAKVSEVLDTNIQPTNEWGESKGEPVSLREMVGKAARDYLGVKVDKEGRQNNYNADQTRLEFIVKQVVAKTFDYQMQTEVKKAVELARAEAVGKVASVVGDMIIKLK
jgi:hypothetical protein